MHLTKSTFGWGIAYVALLLAVVGGMIYARAQLVSVYGTPAAQDEWDQWRDEAKTRARIGPVKQRVPKSEQPPALVLMQDYFAACLGLSVLLSSVLFATFMFFVRGVLNSRGEFVDRSPKESA